MGGGDAAKVETGRNKIKYALIGVAVAVISKGLMNIVIDLLTQQRIEIVLRILKFSCHFISGKSLIFRLKNRNIELTKIAQVAESADAIDLGSIEINLVGVQISPWALFTLNKIG